jgi:hypothetical protein
MIVRFCKAGLSAILVLALIDSSCGQESSNKHAVPSISSRKEVEQIVKQIFEDDYAKAKTPSANLALAKKLFQKAKETRNDVIGQYVLLREAQGAAINAGDSKFALQVVNELDRVFEIDAMNEKVDTLVNVEESARVRAQQAALARSAAELLEEAAQADDYEAAEELGDLAYGMARRSRDRDLLQAIKARMGQIREAEAAFEKTKIALKTLDEQPADPSANLTAGKYFCFRKGNWVRGLPMLAKCREKDLSTLAKLEISDPTSSEKRVKLADQWWDLAETFEDEIQEQYQVKVHAAQWYRKALPKLTGIQKLRVEQRLEELQEEKTQLAADSTTSDKARIIEIDGPAGAKFEMQDDASFFVSGKNPNSADYSLVIRTGRQPILGFRLDTLPDERLPKGGPGRRVNGNYILTDVELSLADAEGEFTLQLPITAAEADYAQPGFAVTHAIDDKDQTGWSVGPEFGKPHWAAFRLAAPVKSESLMKLVLRQRKPGGYNLGRFRIVALTKNGWSVIAGKPKSKTE